MSDPTAHDPDLLERIRTLVAEEHTLREERSSGEVDEAQEAARLARLEVELDQCWDLLRRRQAMRSAGQDPAGAQVRPADVVENYRQ